MDTDKYRFWIAGPQHIESPRVVVAKEIEHSIDHNLNPDDVMADLSPWIPTPATVDPLQPGQDPVYDETTANHYFFMQNRIYYDSGHNTFVYQEPYGKWEADFKKAMRGLELKVEPVDSGGHRLTNSKPVTRNFNGWAISDWRVETAIPSDRPEFGQLMWDVVVWEKDFSGKDAKVTVRHAWRLY